MSYNPPPPYAAPPPVPGQEPLPPRPKTVTAAAGLLVAEAVLLLVGAIVGLLTRDTVQRAVDDYLEAHDLAANSNPGVNAVSSTIGIIFGLVYAAGLVALALGVLRRSNVARIIAWVICGLALCCVSAGPIAQVALYSDYLPGGYLTYTVVVGLLQFIGFIAIIVLLALPASNVFFRKPQTQF